MTFHGNFGSLTHLNENFGVMEAMVTVGPQRSVARFKTACVARLALGLSAVVMLTVPGQAMQVQSAQVCEDSMRSPTAPVTLRVPGPRGPMDLNAQALRQGFSQGFALAYLQPYVAWVSNDHENPHYRGVLFFDQLHIPRSLKRWLRNTAVKNGYVLTFNRNFSAVYREVFRQPDRAQSPGAAVMASLAPVFQELHRMGGAHSVEVWRDGRLVGGIPVIHVNGSAYGLSVFRKEDQVGKLALLGLYALMRDSGHRWISTIAVTNFTEPFGTRWVTNASFRQLHREAQIEAKPFFSPRTREYLHGAFTLELDAIEEPRLVPVSDPRFTSPVHAGP